MTIRLTKALREEITQKIFAASDLPKRLVELKKEAVVFAAGAVKASWPKGFDEALAMHPRGWFGQVDSIHISHRIYPEGKERVELDESLIGDLYTHNIHFDDPIPYPVDRADLESCRYNVHLWLRDTYTPKYERWNADRRELQQSTFALLNSFRTVESLLKAAPEIEQYIPKNSVSYPLPALPVQNVIATFLSRGVNLQPT